MSPIFSLLIPTYSLLNLTTCRHRHAYQLRTLLYRVLTHTHSFGGSLEPRSYFSAKTLDQ